MTSIDNTAVSPDLPLCGVRVVDLVVGEMGVVGRHLADLGAEVIRVEPQGGAQDRHAAPLVNGVSLAFANANLGKRSVVLDLSSPADIAHLDRLLAHSDILLHGGHMANDIDGRGMLRKHPHLVVQSISGFGVESPSADWRVSDPVIHALSGELSRSGNPGREPQLPPSQLAYACAASQASFTVLLAYYNKLQTGVGDWLDFSILDGAVHALDPGYGIAGSASNGVPASKLPRSRPEARFQYPIIPCKDGHVRICVLAARQWQGMFKWMGSPEEFADPSFASIAKRFSSTTLIPAITQFFSTRTRSELEVEGQRHGVPVGAVLSMEEAIISPQATDRKIFERTTLENGVSAMFVRGNLELDGRRASGATAVESVGQSQTLFEQDLGPRRAQRATQPATRRPLEGLRVLDLGVIVVGAEQGRLLADQGAQVYKVENAGFPDGSRQSLDGARLPVTFAAGHRNKLGLGLNLRSERGKEIFKALVRDTDIILSNFKPGTLDALGLGYDELRSINPGIVMADSSAFGPTGTWSKRLGYGPLVRASSGLTQQWRHADDPQGFCDALTVYPDHTAARVGVMGVLALLIRRIRSGKGGAVSVAQSEVMFGQMGTYIAELTAHSENGALVQYAEQAPCGLFPCAGEDEWCVITVQSDEQWQSLCAVINRKDLAADDKLARAQTRMLAREHIEAAVGSWTRLRPPEEAMRLLQKAGVPAGAMLRVIDLPGFDHFEQRNVFRSTTHPEIADTFLLEAAPVHSINLPDPPEAPAPLLGQHTEEILTTRLALTKIELAQLIEQGDIEAPTMGSAA